MILYEVGEGELNLWNTRVECHAAGSVVDFEYAADVFNF